MQPVCRSGAAGDQRSDDDDDESSTSTSKSTDDSSPSSSEPENIQTKKMFSCPEQTCAKMFIRYSALERHCELGEHKRCLEKITLQDRAKLSYAEHLQEGQTKMQPSLPVSSSSSKGGRSSQLPMGWALKSSSKNTRFSTKQKNFLDMKFNLGEQTGKKSSGDEVAQQMRRARGQDGTRLFSLDEFLTPQQISSYFSRMAAKKRKLTEQDLEAEEEAILLQRVTVQISAELASEHE